ncbi:MAG: cobaltochelatase subunit CobN [Spirochaetota bacterium]|nr:cobaltochelatase subunit CobN [Spirochaetota bacterium]
MKKIIALTTINNTLSLREAMQDIRREYGNIVEIKKIYFDDYDNPDVSLQKIEDEIDASDIILIDIRGDVRVGRELPSILEQRNKTIVVLVAGSVNIFALTRMGKFRGTRIFNTEKDRDFNLNEYIRTKKFAELTKRLAGFLPVGMIRDMRNWIIAQEYYTEGNPENFKNLILFLLKKYTDINGIKKISPPKKQPPFGLYLPGKGLFEDIEEYKKEINYDTTKATVGALIYNGMHFDDTRPVADALYNNLKRDVNLIFLFSNVENNIHAIRKYLKNIDLFINMQYFRVHGGPFGGDPELTYQLFQEIDAPCLIGLRSYESDLHKWKENNHGLNPLETALGIVLPELDGGIEPVFLAGLRGIDDPDIGKIKEIRVIEDRIEKLGRRIKKWLALRIKDNRDKRIAVITYNYPPGEENVASSGYLDVFNSLEIFLQSMRNKGYMVNLPEDIKELFLGQGIVNSPKYYERSGLRVSKERYISWFKSLPDTIQREVIERWGDPPGDIMTDGTDILIPGVILGNIFLGVQPSRGVHEDMDKSYHDKDLPPHHQYLAYYMYLENDFKMDAVVHFGMHGTLEFTKGKEVALSSICYPDILIGSVPNIYYYWIGNTSESTIAKRRSYALCISHASPPMKAGGLYEKYIVLEDLLNQYDAEKENKIHELIAETAEEMHLPCDPEELRKELFRIKRRLIPFGLHIMDSRPEKDALVYYLMGVLRIEREFPSLYRLLAEEKSQKWDMIRHTAIEDKLEQEMKVVIEDIINNTPPEWLPEGYAESVKDIADRVNSSCESEGLLRALDGRYIVPACGGDPIRDPEVYPSGRGMYAFDPRLIPTVAAEMRGEKAAGQLLNTYLSEHREYPETVGVVLWGFETMKTGGDTISLILSLIGVRIKHKKSPWFKELELISLDELKRPRIDVVITICGIFRDTFASHIDLLNRAIDMAAMSDESVERNFIRKHYLNIKDEMKDSAKARIFGPSPGEYATSMRTMVENSTWDDEGELVRHYDDSMSYAYFKGRAERSEHAFTHLLKSINLITQERDNTEYEVTDLDHYYEFLGGLSISVQDKRGGRADVMVIDSTEDEVAVEDLQLSIERATRTRTLNPAWLKGMLKHDFHGAKNIKDRVECLLGFSATTGKVKNWVFDKVADRLVFDEDMRRELQSNNPYAAIKICETLMESQQRGYWNIDEEKLKELRDIILNMEGELE